MYGLIFEEVPDTDNAYRRVGAVGLACYNLCRVIEAPKPGFVYYMHPTQRSLVGISVTDYEIKEW